MASLATSRTDLQNAVCYFVGWGSAYSTRSTAEKAAIDGALDKGCRKVYWNVAGHDWSFLHPVATLTTYAPYSTGTVEIATGALTTVTLTDGVFPSWVAGCQIAIDGARYTISTRDSNTQVTLTASFAGTLDTDLEYSVEHTGIFDAPADFGSFDGAVTFAARDYHSELLVVGEGQIRAKQQYSDSVGVPRMIAWRPRKMAAAGVQAFEFVLYPRPSQAWVLTYPYRVQPPKLDTTYTYPYGADKYGDLFTEACLSAAEEIIQHITGGEHQASFARALQAAIADDLKSTPGNLGHSRRPRETVIPVDDSVRLTIGDVTY